jgi:TPR repeat protein
VKLATVLVLSIGVFGCVAPRPANSAYTPSTPHEQRWTDACTEFAPEGGHCPADFPRDEAKTACDQGNACACMKLGGFVGCKKADRVAATELFQRACDHGLIASCANLGVIVFWGMDVPADKPRGLTLWQKACDGGYAFACRNLADVLEKGDTVPADTAAAAKYRARAAALAQKPAL